MRHLVASELLLRPLPLPHFLISLLFDQFLKNIFSGVFFHPSFFELGSFLVLDIRYNSNRHFVSNNAEDAGDF